MSRSEWNSSAPPGNGRRYAKTICSMLNGLGGYVVFGVDDKGSIVGQQVSAQTVNAVAAELQRIEPPAFPSVETIALENGKAAIMIAIPGVLNGTYQYDGRAYIRREARTERMPRGEFSRRTMEQLHGAQRWENSLAPDWVQVSDLDGEEIQNTLSEAIRLGRLDRQFRGQDTESILRGLELIKDGRLLNAAVTLYGKDTKLMPFFSQCGLVTSAAL